MNKKKGALTGTVLFLFLAAAIAGGSLFDHSAEADPPPLQIAQADPRESDTAQQEFQRLDINEDGKIDRTEANALMPLSKQFSDLTGSGALSREEYLSWISEQPSDTLSQ